MIGADFTDLEARAAVIVERATYLAVPTSDDALDFGNDAMLAVRGTESPAGERQRREYLGRGAR